MKPFVLTVAFVRLIGAQTAPPGPVLSDPVVAVVDGKQVTAGDIHKMAEISPPSFVQSLQKDPVQAVEAYFLMRYLGEEGKKLRLDEESPLKEQLEVLRMNALAEAYFNHELNAYTPTTEEIEGYYAKNQTRYQQVRISGIKVSFRTGASVGVSPDAVAEAARRALLEAHGVGNRSEAEARELAQLWASGFAMARTSALWSMRIRTIQSQRPEVETSARSRPQATFRRIGRGRTRAQSGGGKRPDPAAGRVLRRPR